MWSLIKAPAWMYFSLHELRDIEKYQINQLGVYVISAQFYSLNLCGNCDAHALLINYSIGQALKVLRQYLNLNFQTGIRQGKSISPIVYVPIVCIGILLRVVLHLDRWRRLDVRRPPYFRLKLSCQYVQVSFRETRVI